jgi:hypothetical protein
LGSFPQNPEDLQLSQLPAEWSGPLN